MNHIPHFINPTEVIVSASDCGRYVIVGDCERYNAKHVWRYCRLRWDAEAKVFVKSNTRKSLGLSVGKWLPADAFESYEWFESPDAVRLTSLHVEPQLKYPKVSSAALKKFAQLASKAGGEDTLIAVSIDDHTAIFETLGPARLFNGGDVNEHNSGNGSCVVYAHALKQMLKDAHGESIAIGYTGPEHRKILRYGDSELWTVNRRVDAPDCRQQAVHYPLAAAMRRAFDFASDEKTRPILSQIMVRPLGADAAMVYGTDGHSLHRERVTLPQPLPRTFTVSTSYAKQLPRGEYVALAFDEHVRLTLKDGSSVRVDTGPTFPPCDTLFRSLTAETYDTAVLAGPSLRAFRRSLVVASDAAEVAESSHVFVTLDGPDSVRVAHRLSDKGPYQRVTTFDPDKLERLFAGIENECTLELPHSASAPLAITSDNIERLLMPCRTN